MAILGANGAGKTTLLKILAGQLEYDGGQVTVAKGRRLGVIDQIPVYPAGWSVEQVLRSAYAEIENLRQEMARLEEQMSRGQADAALLARYGEAEQRLESLAGTSWIIRWIRWQTACRSAGRCGGSPSPCSPAGSRPGSTSPG